MLLPLRIVEGIASGAYQIHLAIKNQEGLEISRAPDRVVVSGAGIAPERQREIRDALRHALELDVAIETTETEESRAFNDILKKEGARAAIAWRDRQLD